MEHNADTLTKGVRITSGLFIITIRELPSSTGTSNYEASFGGQQLGQIT